jgi:electron transfer flavoprotein alpha subunit
MKILVPVKRVVDFNVKVRVKADQTGVELANVKMSMNPFDEIAVEEALKLREAGKATEVIVVSAGPPPARRRCAPRSPWAPTARSWWRPTPSCSRWRWPSCCKAVAAKESPGLVILGKQAIDDDANQVGQMLAALLDWPQAVFASKVEIGDGSARVTREIDGGLETVEVKLPAIVTTDLRLNTPRYATLPNIMKAKKKPLDTLKPADLGVDVAPRLKTLKVAEPGKRKAGVMVKGRERAGGQAEERSQGDPMSALVIAEHDNSMLKGGTANAVTAAAKMGGDVHVLVAGANADGAAQAASKLAGVSKVLHVKAAHYDGGLAENYAALVVGLAKGYSHVVASASAFGKGFMPRVAALLDVAQVSEISAVESPDTFVRPIYAGNAFATVQSADAIKVVTVRATGFDPAAATGSAPIENVAPGPDKGQSKVLSQELTKSARPELGGARRVVSGGRGLASGDTFKIVEALADKLGAAVGASARRRGLRLLPQRLPGGADRKIVAPELYIAVGISGAIQHLAGMKDSKVIVAINKDPEAPIFQVADYGLVGDLFQIVPELTAKL